MPGWSKEAVLEGLGSGLSLTRVCKDYALEASWKTLWREVSRWRTKDPNFDSECRRRLEEYGRTAVSPGAPRKEDKDPALADWKLRYCEDYIATQSKSIAAERSPFDWSTIVKKTNPNYQEYDPEFAEMVSAAQLKLTAAIETVVAKGVLDPDIPFEKKANAAIKWLERNDPQWNPKIHMVHSGQIRHEHEALPVLTREERLALLAAEQQKVFSIPALALAEDAGVGDESEVIEAEVVGGQL